MLLHCTAALLHKGQMGPGNVNDNDVLNDDSTVRGP